MPRYVDEDEKQVENFQNLNALAFVAQSLILNYDQRKLVCLRGVNNLTEDNK